ncbi:LysR substrate binding domain protein [compost metagenome]
MPTLATSSGETQRQLALRGVGIACLSDFVVREDIKAGRLVKLMESEHTDYLQPMHAVYHRNTQLSRRIACFLDFFAARM